MSRLEEADADKLSGNFILTFGRVGSGKTTFHNTLLRFLSEGSPPFTLEPLAGSDDSAFFKLREWREQWRNGALAPANDIDSAECYEFQAKPLEELARFPEVEFGIFEISGEDYEKVVKSPSNPDPFFPGGLQRFLSNPKIKFILVFVCDGEHPEKDDEFFENFIDLFDSQFNARFARRFWQMTPILLVISKPTAARTRLKDSLVKGLEEADEEFAIIEAFLTRFYRKVRAKGIEFQASFLNVGEIQKISETTDDGPEILRQKLIRPDFVNIRDIFGWMYKNWTGITIIHRRESFWQLFKKAIGLS